MAQIRQIEKSINTAEHMIRGQVLIEVEGVKQAVLIAAALSHHAGALPSLLL
jgi:predicted HD phosphohydrolase